MTQPDSRLKQIEILLDDVRCLAADLLEEGGFDQFTLTLIRARTNDALKAAQRMQGRAS